MQHWPFGFTTFIDYERFNYDADRIERMHLRALRQARRRRR